MPTADSLDGVSSTRQLARSILYEALGMYSTPDLSIQPKTTPRTTWTRQGIYDAVCHFVETHERMPSWNEWRRGSQYGLPARATVQLQWGSCGALIQAVREGFRHKKNIEESQSMTTGTKVP